MVDVLFYIGIIFPDSDYFFSSFSFLEQSGFCERMEERRVRRLGLLWRSMYLWKLG